MGLLFKTTLVHTKKNSFVVFVLSFFVSSGVVVFSSSDLLRDNLNKGFQEINFDGNPHDLILLSKSFKSDQNLNIIPAYESNFKTLKMTPRWGYRWSFDNLKDDFYVKAADYSKVYENSSTPSTTTQPSSSQSSTSDSAEPKIKKLQDYNFYVPKMPQNNKSSGNDLLTCPSATSFFSNSDASLKIMDYHKAGYVRFGGVPDEDRYIPEMMRRTCTDGSAIVSNINGVNRLLNSIGSHYIHHIAKDDENNKGENISGGTGDNSFTITRDELYEFHRASNAINPGFLWYVKTSKGGFPFMKMWEKDHYLSTEVPFKILMSSGDLAAKFRGLVTKMVDPKVYFRLDESTRQQINYFHDTNLFNKVQVRYWISGISKMLPQIDMWLPMIPGLTHPETTIMLFKMFIWKYLEKPEKTSELISSEGLFEGEDKMKAAKDEFKEMMNKWNESTKGFEEWNPFTKFINDSTNYSSKEPLKDQDKEKLYSNSADFVFSTLRPQKTIGEYQKLSLGEYEKWSNENSEVNGTSKSNLTYEEASESTKLIQAVKDIFTKWIEGDYYIPEKQSSSTKIIPAFARNSYKKYQAAKSTNTSLKPFADNNDHYRNFPYTFEEFYRSMYKGVYDSISSYLLTLAASNLKIVKRFISESEIFTLSFLLHNFAYDPNKAYESQKRRRGQNRGAGLDNDISISIPRLTSYGGVENEENDFSPLINYHKSAVVTNSGSTSAKLNDPSKTWHSYKVISQERKDDAYVNRIKILSGNALFEPKLDLLSALTKFRLFQYEYLDFFNVLKRMKYKVPYHAEVNGRYADYFSNINDDKWTDQTWLSFKDIRHLERFEDAFRRSDNNIVRSGARVTAMMDIREVIEFTRTFKVINELVTPPTEGYIDQFSAYFTVVSPFYAESNNITPISNEKYNYFKKIVEGNQMTQEEWEREYAAFVLDPSNHDHIINVNGNKMIVVGIGMSPDMLLPSHSFLSLVPNKSKEALIFVDKYGYENIKYNSLSSWDEYYLSISYPQSIKIRSLEDDYRSQIFDYISEFVDEDVDGTRGSSSFELREVNGAPMHHLVFLRSQYVDNFMFSVSALFNLILSFMGLVIFFTVWVLVKRHITSSLNTFGVFVANGISKLKIIANVSMFIFIPALLGVVVGYLVALGIQPVIFSLISNVWYLTPVFSGFSTSTLFYYILLTFAVLGPISWICSFLMLRGDVNKLMKMNMVFKHNWLTHLIYKHLNHISSLWKFRLSVIMNTIGRGLILSSATVFLFVFTSFLFNNFGQFQAVSANEIGTKDYGFSIYFETPTQQSGQPHLISYSNLGDTFLDKTTHKKQVFLKKDSNSWDSHDISFHKDRPEIIGTGFKNIYSPKDIYEYFAQCKSTLKADDWYDKLGFMDTDYPGNSLEQNPYNMYLFGRFAERKKENGSSVAIDCNKSIEENYTTEKFKFVPQDNAAANVFGKSQSQLGKDQAKFSPKIDPKNKIEYLGDYVPVEDELRDASLVTSANGTSAKAYDMVKYGSEPLFKPLIDHYKAKAPLLSKYASEGEENKSYGFLSKPDTSKEEHQGSGTQTKLSGDFVSFDSSNKHPTLSRLFRDSANYWLFTYLDLASIMSNPTFLKNKVLLPILFNHNWTFSLFGTTITFNPWNEFSEFFAKYSTELVASLDQNYSAFVNEIIKSRYGAFFVNRFMDKHAVSDVDSIVHAPGKKYWNKPTWKVTDDILAEHNKNNKVDKGLYWINPDKLVYFHEKLQSIGSGTASTTQTETLKYQHPERFVIFRPDFLYLIYAILKDPAFQKEDVAPIKVSFHGNVYVPDYSNKFQEFSILGDPSEDAKQLKGLTASDSSLTDEDYLKTPNGDQTYTYMKAQIDGLDGSVDITGVKQDKRGTYLKLRKGDKIINPLLYKDKFEDGAYPMIINHYTARKLEISVGSTISAKISNTYDRFNKLAKGQSPDVEVKFRIVDIYDSYYKPAFYVSQKYANEILGLSPEYGYNGIYTKTFDNQTELPMQLTKAISGYSPSGIYARQKIGKNDGQFQSFLKTIPPNISSSHVEWDHPFIHPKNEELIKRWLGFAAEDSSYDMAAIMENMYGNSFSLSSSIVHLENASLFNDFVFSTVSDLIISVINLFITVFTPLLVFALLVITNLIIEDLKNLLTILNLLGFTYAENSVTILLYLGLVLAFSTLVALPISSSLLSLYVNGIFNTLSIYLPIYMRFEYVAASFAILLGMFSFSYYISRRKIKSLYLPVAMKSLNEQ